MTPGTLSVDLNEEKSSLYVHWINAKVIEPEETSEAIAKPFERFLTRVFE
jgi:multicomponent Na+:H+ antiporter subunit E